MFLFPEASAGAQAPPKMSLTYRDATQVSSPRSGGCAVSREISWASPEFQLLMVLYLSPVLR